MTTEEIIELYKKFEEMSRKDMTDAYNELKISDRIEYAEYLRNLPDDKITFNEFKDDISKQAIQDFWNHERTAIINGTSTYNWTSEQDVCKIISEISVDAGVNNNAPTVLYSGILCNYSTNKIVKSMNIIKIRINIVFLLLKPIGKLF